MHTKPLPRLGLPNLGLGITLADEHLDHFLNNQTDVGWFEVNIENFIDRPDLLLNKLLRIRKNTPIVMYSVSFAVGGKQPVNFNYLKKVKRIADIIEPAWIADHVCANGAAFHSTYTLEHIPLTAETLNHTCDRVMVVQDYLKRPLIIENTSNYQQYRQSTISEWGFLSTLAMATGCGLVIDLDNICASAIDHRYDLNNYLNSLPHRHIVQLRKSCSLNYGETAMDSQLKDSAWTLYNQVQYITGGVSTCLSWNIGMPDYSTVLKQFKNTQQLLSESGRATFMI